MAMDSEFDQDEFNDPKYIENYSKDLCSKNKSILDLVASLQCLLTNKDSSKRARGVTVLADVIGTLPHALLSQSELTHLAEFFLDRMRDNVVVQSPLLNAIILLFSQKNLSDKDAEKFMRGFFLEVHCQSLSSEDRIKCYQIFISFCQNFSNLFQTMFDDVVYAVLNAATGERIPRNLLMVFSLTASLAPLLTKSNLADELFELPAAYFPVDYVPPEDDPYCITAEDLVLSLRKCLTSTTAWSEPLLDLLLEKMSSTENNSKIDAYCTLSGCSSLYTSTHTISVSPAVWSHIRRDVVDEQSEDVAEAALECLQSYTGMIHSSVCDAEKVQSFVTNAIYECSVHISSPRSKLMVPASKLLLSIVTGSDSAAQSVAAKVLPLLHRQITTQEDISSSCVSVMGQFITKLAQHSSAIEPSTGVLSIHRQELSEAVSVALKSTDSNVCSAAMLSASIQGVWSEACQQQWALSITTKILNGEVNEEDKEFRKMANVSLSKLTETTNIKTAVLDSILSHCDSNRESLSDSVLCLLRLTALKDALCVERTIKLLWLDVTSAPSEATLDTLSDIVMKNKEIVLIAQKIYADWLPVRTVVDYFSKYIFDKECTNVSLLKSVSGLLRNLTVPSSVENIALCETLVTQLLLNKQEKGSISSYVVYLVEGLLCCTADLTSLSQHLIDAVLTVSLTEETPILCQQTASIIIANLLLKLPKEQPLLQQLSTIKEKIKERSTAAVYLLARVCQVLEMRGHECSSEWYTQLQECLIEETVGLDAAECYKFMLEENHFALNRSTSQNFRMFYSQRAFSRSLPLLVNQLQQSKAQARHCCLIAIANLLSKVTSSHLGGYMEEVTPIVVEGIRCTSEPAVVTASLATLHSLLQAEQSSVDKLSDFLSGHMSSLVGCLLSLTDRKASFEVRVKACQCVHLISRLKNQAIFPYRDQIIRGLRPALDDHKRAVRKEATDAKCRWMMLDS